MTIPTLVSSTHEKVAISRLQKSYSVFESAFRMAISENGTVENWGLKSYDQGGGNVDASGSANILAKIRPYLRILKECNATGDCKQGIYRNLGGKTEDLKFTFGASGMLADSSLFVIVDWNDDCGKISGTVKNICGALTVDINGFNNPNQMGIDTFTFYITKTGIIPWGTQGVQHQPFNESCAYKGVNSENGLSCTAWVLYNNNMDYLHCNGLSWDGKKSCD